MKDEIRRQSIVQWLLWAALLLALLGSLRHVAHTFTTVDKNVTWGWIQALAVDAGLFALALGITLRRRQDRSAYWLWVGVVLFSAISIYANLAYGLTYTLDTLPAWVDDTKPYILAGTLPILVLYLAEIVGSDVSYYVKEAQKDQRKKARQDKTPVQVDANTSTIEHARTVRAEQVDTNRAQRQRQIVDILAEQPDTGPTALARAVNTSRTTVYSDLDALIEKGIIARNGQGYIIKEPATEPEPR